MVSDMLRSQGNFPQIAAFRIELFEDVSAMTARRKARTQRAKAKDGNDEVEDPVTNGASRNTPKKTPARSRKTVPEVHDPPKRKAKPPPTERTSKQKSTPKAENMVKANGALKPSKPDPAKPKSSTGRGKKVPKTDTKKAASQSEEAEEAEEASGGVTSTSSTMSSSATLTSLTSSTTSSSKKSAVQKQKDQKDQNDSGQSKKRKAPSSKDSSSETEEKTEKPKETQKSPKNKATKPKAVSPNGKKRPLSDSEESTYERPVRKKVRNADSSESED